MSAEDCSVAAANVPSTIRERARVPLSVLIPVKNEAENLPRCLASVAWADEIVVVDSASADGSQRIAEEFGATVVQFIFRGNWPKKKNWALENVRFKHDWILILDADEVLPEGAEEEFARVMSSEAVQRGYVGYWINRRFMFMGRWLRHAYYPNWNLRLFKHRLGRYEKLTNSDTRSGDNEVHEHVIVDGRTGFLKIAMDHYAFPSIDVFIEKHNRYSNWEAQVALESYLRIGADRLQKREVGTRRRLKRWSHILPFSSSVAVSLCLHLAAGFSGWVCWLLLCATSWDLRTPVCPENIRVFAEKSCVFGVWRFLESLLKTPRVPRKRCSSVQ